MIKYQYQTLSLCSHELDDRLNAKGNQGWRLISIVHDKHTKLYECVFEKVIIPIDNRSFIPK